MTMTVSEPTGSPAALPGDAEPRAPLPQVRANDSRATEPQSEAERLLAAPASDRAALVRRLSWGFAGLSALGAGPQLALTLVGAASSAKHGPLGFIESGLGLPFAAALTVTLPLPGLLILLGMQGDRADPRAELLRVQCELSNWVPELTRRQELRRREEELLRHLEPTWMGPLPPYCLGGSGSAVSCTWRCRRAAFTASASRSRRPSGSATPGSAASA